MMNQVEIRPASVNQPPFINPDRLNLVIRTDRRFATETLKHGIVSCLKASNTPDISRCLSVRHPKHEDLRATRSTSQDVHLERLVESHLKVAYSKWATSILQAMQDQRVQQPCNDNGPQAITAHIFKNRELESACKELADKTFSRSGKPVFQLTLDEQIEGDGELGISRLFDRNGNRINNEDGEPIYIARPEKDSIEVQLATLRSKILAFKAVHTMRGRVPVVLLEDNVRHAKMLNKVIEILRSDPALKNLIKIKGIATEFCCASQEELEKIKSNGDPNGSGRNIPTEPVITFNLEHRDIIDVTTPRDFFFDGLVVKLDDGSIGRMPSFYVDGTNDLTESSENVNFITKVKSINSAFCSYLNNHLGVSPRIGWFRGGSVIRAIESESDSYSESGSENSVQLSDPIDLILKPTVDSNQQTANNRVN